MPTPHLSSMSVVLHTPAHAVLAAPLMLGYWPDNSLCAIFVDAEQCVALIMRWDADAQAAIPAVPPAAAGESSPRTVHLVAYTAAPRPGEPPAAPDPSSWRHVQSALRDSGMSLGWVLVASTYGDKVSWTCVEGSAADLEVRAIPASASTRQAQRWGLPPWSATRSDYVGDIDPDRDVRDHVIMQLPAQSPVVEASRDAAIATVRDRLADEQVSAGDIAEVLVSLTDVQVRDTVLWDLMQEDPSRWKAIAARMARIVAAAPDTHVAAPATLLAILRWQMGDGSRATAAIERALSADPAYTLARLVDGCLATGMHPGTWRGGLADLSREACRRAA